LIDDKKQGIAPESIALFILDIPDIPLPPCLSCLSCLSGRHGFKGGVLRFGKRPIDNEKTKI